MSNSFDELQKENKEIKRRLEEESRDLHNAKKRISELERKIDSIVEEKLEKNIVIMKVPKQEQEKTEEMVSSIIGHIGVSIATLDFKARHISQAANSPILLELNDRNTRNLILKKQKEAGVLKMENCGCSGKNIVYFNEDLTGGYSYRQGRLRWNANISSRGVRKVPGCDGLTAEFLKEVAQIISESLCYVINEIIETAECPPQFKLVVVRHLYKGGVRTEFSN
ncbi:hypothetical protein HHI36_007447 [Cryptolaemus montrouzieri]|uniref:Uncharacterized protein n=1 Tax=Cryptolaemus montrouzieri TaxID=559131 RepID=A0ABD2MPJ0_9CUCU